MTCVEMEEKMRNIVLDNDDNALWESMIEMKNIGLDNILRCECGSDNLVRDDNLMICKDCSRIMDNVIDCSAEWRFIGNDEKGGSSSGNDPCRCGMPTSDLLPKSSLGTIVGKGRKDCIEVHWVRKLQTWTIMPYDERKLVHVFEKYKNNTANEGISAKVMHDAKKLYKQVASKKISRGENSDGLIASCMYYSCMMNRVPRSTKEIADMFSITEKVLTKGNARFQKLMPMNVGSTGPKDFISRFGSQMNMSKNEIDSCVKLAEFLESNEIINDNSAISSAAGIISYYSNHVKLQLSRKHIASVCGVSEVTITQKLKKIMKYDEYVREFVDNVC